MYGDESPKLPDGILRNVDVALEQRKLLRPRIQSPAASAIAPDQSLAEQIEAQRKAAREAAFEADLKLRLEAEIAAARQKALEDGYAEGHAEGMKSGHVEGFQRGHEEGLAAARVSSEQQLDEAIKANQKLLQEEALRQREALEVRATQLMADIEARATERIAELEQDLCALAWEISCRVIGDKACSAEAMQHMVNASLSAWKSEHPVTIHLHPQDLETLLRAEAMDGVEILNSSNAGRISRWMPDSQIELGGCNIKSPDGGLDARLENQLRSIKDALANIRKGPPTAEEEAA